MSHIIKKKKYNKSKIRAQKPSQQRQSKNVQSKRPARRVKVTKSHKSIQ